MEGGRKAKKEEEVKGEYSGVVDERGIAKEGLK